MEIRLSKLARARTGSAEAERVLRSCVHCGFCNATCPTYQLTGDERDGPRGRIYLIKQMLETDTATQRTQWHLDRCLTCRNCETTCPSGVDYHVLLDHGRAVTHALVPRPVGEQIRRWALRHALTQRALFSVAVRIGQRVGRFLPARLRSKVPAPAPRPGSMPRSRHARRVLLPEGCVQPTLSPNTVAAAARLLDRLAISVVRVNAVTCCGAVEFHLDAQGAALNRARRNIDAWWPYVEGGIEAIVQTASGCGSFVKEYGHLLRGDPAYAERARKVSELALDIAEVIEREPIDPLTISQQKRAAFQVPCSLQHGQKLGLSTEALLTRLGLALQRVTDPHLCCGSAGTYSVTQPKLSLDLRERKLANLLATNPEVVLSANVGCQVHLQAGTTVPVMHWVEWVDYCLTAGEPTPG